MPFQQPFIFINQIFMTRSINRLFFFNIILAGLIIGFISRDLFYYSGFEILLALIVSGGLIGSFLIKEVTLRSYLKIAFLTSIIFGIIFELFFILYVSTTDIDAHQGFSSELILDLLLFLMLLCSANFAGYLIGIIPKGIIERLK